MKRNVGNLDRVLRALTGTGLSIGAFVAPWPLLVRGPGFGGVGLYLVGSVLARSCLGYRLLGISMCPIGRRNEDVRHGESLAGAQGDDEALALLVQAYHDRVYRFGLRGVSRSVAQDAFQEAFAKLARRPDLIRDDGVLLWLFRVVRNTCMLLRPFARQRRALGERIAETERVPSPQLDA